MTDRSKNSKNISLTNLNMKKLGIMIVFFLGYKVMQSELKPSNDFVLYVDDYADKNDSIISMEINNLNDEIYIKSLFDKNDTNFFVSTYISLNKQSFPEHYKLRVLNQEGKLAYIIYHSGNIENEEIHIVDHYEY